MLDQILHLFKSSEWSSIHTLKLVYTWHRVLAIALHVAPTSVGHTQPRALLLLYVHRTVHYWESPPSRARWAGHSTYRSVAMPPAWRQTMPAYMEDDIDAARPSLLAFRSTTRAMRASVAHKQQLRHAVAAAPQRKQEVNEMDNDSPAEDPNAAAIPTRVGRVDSAFEFSLMPMPLSGSTPILESPEDVMDEDDGLPIDGDFIERRDSDSSSDFSYDGRSSSRPTHQRRSMIVEEDGFTLSRETMMLTAASMQHSRVLKTGLLFKQGSGLGFLHVGGWKVRYVVLTSSYLTFYREENGRKRGEVDLGHCNKKSIEIMPRDSVFDGTQATMWRFAIKTKSRRVIMAAYTEPEMKQWLRCLHVALAMKGTGPGRLTDFPTSTTFLGDKGPNGMMRASAQLH